ncbi:hypothetical protein SAMN02745130_02006 [Thiothrix eikelboomii]|uniref:Uncharacterized protein n=1 Tax=Thiothrix eikelboomii TaxID=92487 RepID=A0A1T4WQ36_9GAMM|nr:hypothetical protein [Thiothrix eikelboomii]SKA79474.1 hypothetical protein SAMN02745130_02006 [Thiothrix eikelboomii]
MHALSFQLSALGIGLLLLGLGIGWWGAHFFQRHARSACYQELVRLRYAHQRLQQDFTELNKHTTHAEAEKNQALAQLSRSQDLKSFEQLRLQLMHTRNQLRANTDLLAKREQQLRRLSDLVKLLRKPTRTPLQLVHPSSSAANPTTNQPLTCLETIDAVNLRKLHMLGILNCEQLAACNTEQLQMLQGLLSEDSALPLDQWVQAARLLTQPNQTSHVAKSLTH